MEDTSLVWVIHLANILRLNYLGFRFRLKSFIRLKLFFIILFRVRLFIAACHKILFLKNWLSTLIIIGVTIFLVNCLCAIPLFPLLIVLFSIILLDRLSIWLPSLFLLEPIVCSITYRRLNLNEPIVVSRSKITTILLRVEISGRHLINWH